MSWRRRCRSDRAVTVVESAFAIPVVIFLMLGMIDVGWKVFQNSEATSAARDGARLGILKYKDADVAGSANNTAIVTEVGRRIVDKPSSTVTVTCVDTAGTTIVCNDARVDQDRIKVTVTWQYDGLSLFMRSSSNKTVTGTATMTILGLPI